MKKILVSMLVSAVAAVWMAGCGGSVTSGSNGGGGAGGGGAGSGGDTGTTGSTVTSSGALCQQLCDVGQQAGCLDTTVDECVQGCEANYAKYPECAGAFDAAYECGIDSVPVSGCALDKACPTEIQAVVMCMDANGCATGTCSGDGTSCSCGETCKGDDLQVDCTTTAAGIDCTCLVNGAQVGTCTGADLSCDVEGGCCAQFFPL